MRVYERVVNALGFPEPLPLDPLPSAVPPGTVQVDASGFDVFAFLGIAILAGVVAWLTWASNARDKYK